MTPTEKQKCIAEQMLYGLLFLHEETETLAEYAFGRKLLYWRDIIDSKEKLILRPISDITKEITHKGYNNNQPFIPLVELVKIILPNTAFRIGNTVCGEKYLYYEDYTFSYLNGNGFTLKKETKDGYYSIPKPINQQVLLDLLHLWHFDTRNLIELGEAISTDIINPYSK